MHGSGLRLKRKFAATKFGQLARSLVVSKCSIRRVACTVGHADASDEPYQYRSKKENKNERFTKDGAGEKRSAMGWSGRCAGWHHLHSRLRDSGRVRGDGTCGRYEVSRH